MRKGQAYCDLTFVAVAMREGTATE